MTNKRAIIHGTPGEEARLTGLLQVLWPLGLILIAFGYLVCALLPAPTLGPGGTGFLFLVLAVVVGVVTAVTRKRLSAFLKGARGEESVAHELAFLPADYDVFHAPALDPRKGTHVSCDHVVVGPGGVFAIETKSWSGFIVIRDGHILYDNKEPDRPPIDQVKSAVAVLREKLAQSYGDLPDLHPVICFVRKCLVGGTQTVSGVTVCDLPHLHEVILARSADTLDVEHRANIIATVGRMMGHEG
tara:strand:- start:448 stop:1179 length:732 start_codon:yes stop_codon:yes gene_type:complete